jgi:hypothetical protein
MRGATVTIREVPYYEVSCDYEGCPYTLYDATGEWTAFVDREQAVDAWHDADGTVVNETGQTFCWKHFPLVETE